MRFELIREDVSGARTLCALPAEPAAGDVLVLDHGARLAGRFEVLRRELEPKTGRVRVMLRSEEA